MNTYSFQVFPIYPKTILDIGGSSLMCPRMQDKRFFLAMCSFALKYSTTNPVLPIIFKLEYATNKVDLKFKAQSF